MYVVISTSIQVLM